VIEKEPKDRYLKLKHQSETPCITIEEIKNGYFILILKSRKEEKHLKLRLKVESKCV